MGANIDPVENVRRYYSLYLNPDHRLASTLANIELDLTLYVMSQIDYAAEGGESSVVVFPQVSLAENPRIKQLSVAKIHEIYRKVLEAFRAEGYLVVEVDGIWTISWVYA